MPGGSCQRRLLVRPSTRRIVRVVRLSGNYRYAQHGRSSSVDFVGQAAHAMATYILQQHRATKVCH
jgi:hypothetical protein